LHCRSPTTSVVAHRLQASLKAKLLFALTTPAHNTNDVTNDATVKILNKRAMAVMAAANIPTVDLYTPLIARYHKHTVARRP
jgi:hypothetical protein